VGRYKDVRGFRDVVITKEYKDVEFEGHRGFRPFHPDRSEDGCRASDCTGLGFSHNERRVQALHEEFNSSCKHVRKVEQSLNCLRPKLELRGSLALLLGLLSRLRVEDAYAVSEWSGATGPQSCRRSEDFRNF